WLIECHASRWQLASHHFDRLPVGDLLAIERRFDCSIEDLAGIGFRGNDQPDTTTPLDRVRAQRKRERESGMVGFWIMRKLLPNVRAQKSVNGARDASIAADRYLCYREMPHQPTSSGELTRSIGRHGDANFLDIQNDARESHGRHRNLRSVHRSGVAQLSPGT